MKRTSTMKKALLLGTLLLGISVLPLSSPVEAQQGGTVRYFSDNKYWTVTQTKVNTQTNMPETILLGIAQNVCLNSTSPSNCPLTINPGPTLYGYLSEGWLTDLSTIPTATWIWAPNISGDTTPAASEKYNFESTELYVCDPATGGTISVAADDSADVFFNGKFVGNSKPNVELEEIPIAAADQININAIRPV